MHRRRLRSVAALCALGLAPGVFAPAADDAVDHAGKAAAEWIRLRSETVRVETDWREQRELLDAIVTALNERARLAEESVDEARARTARDRTELGQLETGNAALQKGLLSTDERLKAAVSRLVALEPQLPPRLREALALPFKSLRNPELAVGDRAQFVMTILSRCLQFNHLVTTGDEVVTVDGGAPRSLEVAYWGLSHGYALDRAAQQAWVGGPGPRGWHWDLRPELAPAVTRLLTVAGDKAEPEFIVLPATLRHPAP